MPKPWWERQEWTLEVARWPMGDTEERQPMYCLYLVPANDEDKVERGQNFIRIGDVWDEDGAKYLEELVEKAWKYDELK